ncbi:MAG: 4Fe-4S binding protein [Candidatus Bathyarchaeota archaeon]|nr:4Fe-4S binding protein [Candidatus Bathyarchaeum sp.]
MTATETAAASGKNFVNMQVLRRIVQVISFVLFVGVVFGLGHLAIALPVMFTLGLEQQALGDAFAMMQVMLSDAVFPWIPLASFFLVAAILGRSLCGWVCPFGFVQDIVGVFKRKKMEISPRTHNWMIYIKYVIMLIVLIVSWALALALASGSGEEFKSALGVFAAAPFSAFSPADTLFAVIPNGVFNLVNNVDVFVEGVLAVRPLLWARFVVLGGVLMLAAYVPRSWCKYFCPHGAILAFLNRFSFLGLQRDPLKCTKTGCNDCVAACPMNVPILELPWEKFTHPECIYCLKCADACPTKAIKPKMP